MQYKINYNFNMREKKNNTFNINKGRGVICM